MPKYFRVDVVHLKRKLDCIIGVMCGGRAMPIASDLEKFIFRLDSAPYLSNSLRRLGSKIVGFISEKSRSSA